MKIKNWLTAAALCLASLPSYAGVIYEWHALRDESPRNFRLVLEFDEATVQKGSITATLGNAAMGHGFAIPDSGLLSLRYGLGGADASFIEYFPRVPSTGYGDKMVYLSLKFEPDGTLSGGGIRAYSEMHQFSIGFENGVFRVLDVNSDSPLTACPQARTYQCAGATGRLVQVPEPAPLALLAVGFAAVVGGRRQRARQ